MADDTTNPALDAPETPPVTETTPQTTWRDALPETIRGNEKLANFESVDKLVETFLQSQADVDPASYGLPEDMGHFAKLAAENKLSKDQVGKLIAFDKASTAAVEQQYLEGLKQLETVEWKEDFKGNVDIAKQALAHFDKTGEVKQMLEATRAGNNPAVVRFLHAIGLTLQEDSFVKGTALAGRPNRSQADIMYGDSSPKS